MLAGLVPQRARQGYGLRLFRSSGCGPAEITDPEFLGLGLRHGLGCPLYLITTFSHLLKGLHSIIQFILCQIRATHNMPEENLCHLSIHLFTLLSMPPSIYLLVYHLWSYMLRINLHLCPTHTPWLLSPSLSQAPGKFTGYMSVNIGFVNRSTDTANPSLFIFYVSAHSSQTKLVLFLPLPFLHRTYSENHTPCDISWEMY